MSAVVPAAVAGGAAAPTAQEDSLNCEFPYTATDASGAEVTVDGEPERVVTLNPSAAQTMWEIGGREKVVGVSQFAGFLEGASDRTQVTSGFPSQVNVEEVISLSPDLVLAPNTIQNDTVQQLRDADVTVYRFALAASLDDVVSKTERIGQLTGQCDGAEDAVTEMSNTVQRVREAVEGEDSPSVLYYMSQRYTAGPNTFIGQALAAAGGDNIAANANASRPYPQLSEEFIVAQDPEYVVVSASAAQMQNESATFIPEGSAVRETAAYEQGNVVVVNTNNISQPAPRVASAVERMANAFHPEAMQEATQTTTTTTETTTDTTEATTTAMSTEMTSATTTDADDSSNGTTPGFGVATAVVAVLGAALLARR
jgi:iron complex transport system substrate-binding protein